MEAIIGGIVFAVLIIVVAVLVKRADKRREAQKPEQATSQAQDSSEETHGEEAASDDDEEVTADKVRGRRVKTDSDEDGGVEESGTEEIPAPDTTNLPPEIVEARQNVEKYLPTFDLFVRQYIVDPAMQSRWLTAVYESNSQNVSERIYANALERIRNLIRGKKQNAALTLDDVIELALDIESFEVLTKSIEATYVPKDAIPSRLAVYHACKLHHYAKRQGAMR